MLDTDASDQAIGPILLQQIDGREHAFPPREFVCTSAHVTNGGSIGIMSPARQELPYPCKIRPSLGTRP